MDLTVTTNESGHDQHMPKNLQTVWFKFSSVFGAPDPGPSADLDRLHASEQKEWQAI